MESCTVWLSTDNHVACSSTSDLLLLNNNPLCEYIKLCLFILRFCLVSTIWILSIMLLWTFLYTFLHGHIYFLFFWNVPRYEIAELCNSSISNFREIVGLFFKVGVTFYIPQQSMRVPVASHSCPYILLSLFLITAMPVSMKWYLNSVLICISLMANNFEHTFMLFVYIHGEMSI